MSSNETRQKLLDLAQDFKVSLAQLSLMIGRNPSYLQQFVKRGSPRKLEEEDRRTLAQFFGVSERALGASEEISYMASSMKGGGESWVDVPRMNVETSAGGGRFIGGEGIVGAMRFSAHWVRERGLSANTLSSLCVRGDSMDPTLRDGDEVLVDASKRDVCDGIYVVRAEDVLLVKRLYRAGAESIVLVSDNPAYEPQILPVERVSVLGRVVWRGTCL